MNTAVAIQKTGIIVTTMTKGIIVKITILNGKTWNIEKEAMKNLIFAVEIIVAGA